MDARQIRKDRYYRRRKQRRLAQALELWRLGQRKTLPMVSEWFVSVDDMLLSYGLTPNVDIFVPRPDASPNANKRDRKRFQRRKHYKKERAAVGGLYRARGSDKSYRERADEELARSGGTPNLK